MSESDPPTSRYGRERLCPHCGTRVAQKARTCFFCGKSLEDAPRRRRSIPWADFLLFAVIGGLLAFWWLNGFLREGLPAGQAGLQLALSTGQTATPAAASTAEPTQAPTQALPPTATPQPTWTASPAPTPLPTPVRHKVESGDTLELIAGRYGSTIKDIIEANGLTADGFIRAGQELLVPVGGPSGGPGPTATPAGGTLVYTVQPGDTIETIAMRFGSQIDWILEANKVQASDLLSIGQSLLVPLTPGTPVPAATPSPRVEPTPTRAVGFAAPILLAPADGARLTDTGEVLLTWASAGLLAKDQWYVVTLRISGAEIQPAPYWTKGTTWRLSPEFKIAGQEATKLTWQVQAMAGTPGNPGLPLSPPSAIREFTWR